MVLQLNQILNLSQEKIDNSKIEFNMEAGSGGQPFLDRWLKHSETENNPGLVLIVSIGDGMASREIFIRDDTDYWIFFMEESCLYIMRH